MKIKTYLAVLILLGASAAFTKNSRPNWAVGAVWYRIVPERFRNFNPYNDPVKEAVVGKQFKDWQVHPWASDWYKLQIWEANRGADFYDLVEDRRFGGDLLGVMEKLRYLKSLGVNVILLTPVFESPSILKYDASTFHHIDNNFGRDRKGDWDKNQSEKEDPESWTFTSADKVFLDLISKAHELDMKVVIEAEFGYCGREFWAFKDLEENQRESDYKNWFEVTNWDDPATPDTVEFKYESWQGDESLPLFKTDKEGLAKPVKKYLLDITRRWMTPVVDGQSADGIDGWYIRSAETTHPKFWQEWLELVKSLNRDAVTVAESQAGSAEVGFDLTTNDQLAEISKRFLLGGKGKLPVTEFDRALAELRKSSSQLVSQSSLSALTNLSSARLSSMIRNSAVGYTKDGADNNHVWDPRGPNEQQVLTQRLLAIFHLTYLGVPVIFYGDESGMWGGHDPDNLKPMLWRELVYEKETYRTIRPDLVDRSANVANKELVALYAKLGEIRHKYPAIQRGDFSPVLVDDQKAIYCYSRKYENSEVVVALNFDSKKQTLEFPTSWKIGSKVKDLLNDKKFKLEDSKIELQLEKKSGAILVKEK